MGVFQAAPRVTRIQGPARMRAFASDSDANFYRLIHELVVRQSATTVNRRSDRRHPFLTVQQIAGWDGRRFPADEEFFDARCHDLTGCGFSFLSPGRPPFEHLVAAFGKPPEQIFIAAEVRHLAQVLVHAGGTVERLEETRRGWSDVPWASRRPNRWCWSAADSCGDCRSPHHRLDASRSPHCRVGRYRNGDRPTSSG